MKYSEEERMEIGRQIYNGQLTRFQAAEKYGINESTARNYMRQYRDSNRLIPRKTSKFTAIEMPEEVETNVTSDGINYTAYRRLSKDELILKLMEAHITIVRLQKGYGMEQNGL